MMSKAGKFLGGFVLAVVLSLGLSGCVDQHPAGTENVVSTTGEGETVESMLEITDPVEKKAVETAKAKVRYMGAEPRIIATAPATAQICDKL